jgi:hypothetical protein
MEIHQLSLLISLTSVWLTGKKKNLEKNLRLISYSNLEDYALCVAILCFSSVITASVTTA